MKIMILLLKVSLIRELNISPLDAFRLMSVIGAVALEWRVKLKTSAHGICNQHSVIQNQCKLILNGQIVQIKSVVSETINKELRSIVITPPTVQLSFNHQFPGAVLDWKKYIACLIVPLFIRNCMNFSTKF